MVWRVAYNVLTVWKKGVLTIAVIHRRYESSLLPSVSLPVGNDNSVVELAAAVLTQGGAPSVGDDGVGAV